MKILHIIGSLDPAEGGPPMIAAHLAAAQAHAGHQVKLVANDPGDRLSVVEDSMAPVTYIEKVSRSYLPIRPNPIGPLFGRDPRIGELVEESDVLHLHSVWEPILVSAAREARLRNTPYFVLLNGMLDPWSLSQSALKKKIALRLAYRKFLDGASALHLGNEDEKRLIEPLGIKAPGRLIPNGVFLEEIDPLPEEGTFRKEHPELGDRPFILFLSRLHYKKGLDILAEAFAGFCKRDDATHLVVAGPDGGARESFLKAVTDSGVADRVHVVGPIYGSAKYAALRDASCFCLPSRQEGFSVAITEALACGLPCVVTVGCHYPEVETSGAGLVTELSGDAVADALVQVMSNADLRAEMSKNGRDLVARRLTWHVIGERAVEVYNEFLD